MIHCHSYPTNEDVVDLNRGIGNGYLKVTFINEYSF